MFSLLIFDLIFCGIVKFIKNIGIFLCCLRVFFIIFLLIKGSWLVVEFIMILKFFKCFGICDKVNIFVFSVLVKVFVWVMVLFVIVK